MVLAEVLASTIEEHSVTCKHTSPKEPDTLVPDLVVHRQDELFKIV